MSRDFHITVYGENQAVYLKLPNFSGLLRINSLDTHRNHATNILLLKEQSRFILLETCHVQKKIDALTCYKSQMRRSYLTEESVWALACTRGTQLEGGYAEAFEVIRWML